MERIQETQVFVFQCVTTESPFVRKGFEEAVPEKCTFAGEA
jgi:hypothetical protein